MRRAISRQLAAGAFVLALSPAALAQFQVAGGAPRPGTPSPERPRTPMPAELTYSWAVGSHSELTYRKDPDREVIPPTKRRTSILLDQAYASVKYSFPATPSATT